jgi:beta-phosphoglucomutase
MKNIIFDMDGVLIDSIPKHIIAWKTVLLKHNVKVSNYELALHEGSNQVLFLNDILKERNIKKTNKEKQQIINEKKELFLKYKIKLFPIKKILNFLKRKNIKLAVGTGGSKCSVEKNLKEIKDYFEVIINGEEIKKGKPNPETYNKARIKLKSKKQETLVIENAPLGIKAAKNAGLKCYAISTSLPKKYLKEADKIFKNHNELFEYLKKQDF